MIYLGVDPGLSGALAFIDDADAWVVPMPVVSAKKGRARFDIRGILDVLRERVEQRPFAMVEKLQPMPMAHGGTITNFARGMALGVVETSMVAAGIAYELVAPQTWQKAMHAGTSGDDTKQRSIMAAQRLFPRVELKRTARCRKMDDGFAEALLLAEYARRKHTGSRALEVAAR